MWGWVPNIVYDWKEKNVERNIKKYVLLYLRNNLVIVDLSEC